jgi:hypothetical protein
MEGKGISMEQYSLKNEVIAPLTEGTAFGKNETKYVQLYQKK